MTQTEIENLAEAKYPMLGREHLAIMTEGRLQAENQAAYIAGYSDCLKEMQGIVETAKELIDWNKKYPPGRIYPYGEAQTIESELTAIVNKQIEALTTLNHKP